MTSSSLPSTLPRVTFTPKFLATAKPGRDANGEPRYIEYRDAISPLRWAVQPSGHGSPIIRYRRPGTYKSAKLTFDRKLSLAALRHAAAAAVVQIEEGTDPSPPRVAAAAKPAQADDETIEAAVELFMQLHARRRNWASTIKGAERVFRRLVLPTWRGRSIHGVRRRDVIGLIERIAVDRPYLANRTREVLSKFFNWLVAHDRLTTSPVTGVERPHKEEARRRTLTSDERAALWAACEDDEPFGSAWRILLLCGNRRNEVSGMRWKELDFGQRLWTLPPPRTKNGREHVVPLPQQAWDILDRLPQIDGSDFVFTTNGRNPISGGWAKAKTRLSERAGIDPQSWRLHDLRRTAASGMQRLGVRVEVIERTLNHISGVYRGVAGIYQTDPMLDDVRTALQLWADHVTRLGDPAKVVRLQHK